MSSTWSRSLRRLTHAAAALEAKKARTEAAAARARQPRVERLTVAQQLVDRHATITAQLDEARGLRTRLVAFEPELVSHEILDGGVRADLEGIVDKANGALATYYAVDDEGEPIVLDPRAVQSPTKHEWEV